MLYLYTYLGNYRLLKHRPVVGEPPARHDIVREWVAGTTSVSRVEKAHAVVIVVAPERRFGGQENDGQLVPCDRKLEQGQGERYPKLPPSEIAQSFLHRVSDFGDGRRLFVIIVFLIIVTDVQMGFFRIFCHCNRSLVTLIKTHIFGDRVLLNISVDGGKDLTHP